VLAITDAPGTASLSGSTKRRPDPVVMARLVIGCALFAGAPRIAGLSGLTSDRDLLTTAGRLLGARHVAEGLALSRWRSDRTRHAIVAVDVLHGLSMVALAVGSRRLRPLASASALEAFSLAGATVRQTAG
jgi:hypothetical protein